MGKIYEFVRIDYLKKKVCPIQGRNLEALMKEVYKDYLETLKSEWVAPYWNFPITEYTQFEEVVRNGEEVPLKALRHINTGIEYRFYEFDVDEEAGNIYQFFRVDNYDNLVYEVHSQNLEELLQLVHEDYLTSVETDKYASTEFNRPLDSIYRFRKLVSAGYPCPLRVFRVDAESDIVYRYHSFPA